MSRRRLSLLCFVAAALAAFAAVPKAMRARVDCPRGALPAYAHNDYANPRPLTDALALGYQGAEADVFLVGGELRLGHERPVAEHGAALEVEYLAPLRVLVARCGSLTASGQPFLLTVDIKEKSRPTFDSLVALLERYPELFVPGGATAADARHEAPIVVVLVGWYPEPLPSTSAVPLGRQLLVRHVDGGQLRITDPEIRLIGINYRKTMGRWWVTPGRRRRWLSTIRELKAANPSLRIRVFHAPVDEHLYRQLLAARVDLIGTQKLTETARLLGANLTSGHADSR